METARKRGKNEAIFWSVFVASSFILFLVNVAFLGLQYDQGMIDFVEASSAIIYSATLLCSSLALLFCSSPRDSSKFLTLLSVGALAALARASLLFSRHQFYGCILYGSVAVGWILLICALVFHVILPHRRMEKGTASV